ncbi:MAG: ThiF family adenylyltransferase [Thermoguttaceae bacterium]
MSRQQPPPLDNSHLKTVLLAGAGNIGSALAPLLARMENVGTILLVDTDIYEVKNLSCQDISAGDVGRRKVLVQSRRLQRIKPAIDARAYCARVEDLPLGVLRVDAILSCLDSRTSRRYVNQAAWRLGVPWIDGAVDAAGVLARVNAYDPAPEAPCMECGWEDADYDTAALEQAYPCQPRGGGPAATNAPASLGHITAGLMAIECQKLLSGDRESLLAGRQVMLDLRHHTHYVTTFRRGRCRFDHEIWHVEHLDESPAKMTLGQAVYLSAGGLGPSSGCAVRIEGQQFATMQFCPGCGRHEAIALRLADRIPSVGRRCTACGKTMTVRGFDRQEWLSARTLSDRDLARPLCSLGVEPYDVLSIRDEASQRHFVLGASRPLRTNGGRDATGRSLPRTIARR